MSYKTNFRVNIIYLDFFKKITSLLLYFNNHPSHRLKLFMSFKSRVMFTDLQTYNWNQKATFYSIVLSIRVLQWFQYTNFPFHFLLVFYVKTMRISQYFCYCKFHNISVIGVNQFWTINNQQVWKSHYWQINYQVLIWYS